MDDRIATDVIPVKSLLAELDDADCAEREALAAHDAARARLRKARSAYRRDAHASAISYDFPELPLTDSEAEAAIIAAAVTMADAREFHDNLCALDLPAADIIDAAVAVEQARLFYEALKNSYAQRREDSL